MFPFWDKIVAPALELVEARRIVEIGALRGQNTELMLRRLGPNVELHVIDPLPEFDPAEHERRFAGRYIFHKDLSLNVLEELPPVDAALIDGDHNWYTVYNECLALRAVARRAGTPLPLMIFHDVAWPYGRRDLYYEPSQIPEESRQPYEQLGMRKGRARLVPRGGMNRGLANAVLEGGDRNGVMTAVEDFVAEHDQSVRLVVLPLYFGLAILVEEAVLDAKPRLRAFLDHIESAAGKEEVIELGEDIRLDEALFNQAVWNLRDSQLQTMANRYLGLLKGALLDVHYMENELRIGYLAGCLASGRPVDGEVLRDPTRGWVVGTAGLRAADRSGYQGHDSGAPAYFRYTSMGNVRLDALEAVLDTVRTDHVPGDLVECGTGRGGGAIFLRGYLDAHLLESPAVWVADRFVGTDKSVAGTNGLLTGPERGFPALAADLNNVRDGFARFGLLDERVRFLQGDYAATLPDAPVEQIAVLRIADGAVGSAREILGALYDRLAVGGFVVLEGAPAMASAAVHAFRAERGIAGPIQRIDEVAFSWRKQTEAPASPAPAPTGPLARPPLSRPAPVDAVDLSVVVVFYNMRREAARTLHSLSRAYQRDFGEVTYEVLAIDNGSTPEQRLDRSWVESFGPEFRLIDIGSDATSSPTTALNYGLAESRGHLVAFMIDGAHVVTPGVFNNAMAATRAYGPCVVTTQQWYVGPGQQPMTMLEGYDQAEEDELFAAIEWPSDGYRLFEIGSFIGDRDWFDGMSESNCIIVPRTTLEQIGAFDDSFSAAGGGYANLDFWERVTASPGLTVVTMLGEGSFHQVHEGTTTNQASVDQRFERITDYATQYDDIRAKRFKGPMKPVHYVGTLPAGAKRTKPRRRVATAFWDARRALSSGMPEKPFPLPTETRDEFVDAYWNTLNWQKSTWLGAPIPTPAADLMIYQHLLTKVRPDWVIDVKTDDGGRAFFLATICELLGHGEVVTIDSSQRDCRPIHPRIHQIIGNPGDQAVVAQVRDLVGDEASGLVILGSRARVPRTLQEFHAYRDFVSEGSYLVVEMTVVNGHPIWPEFGPGPFEAVVRIASEHREFIVDHEVEIHGMSFNPGGFLKRVR